MTLSSIKGFRDLLPDESARRQRILDSATGVLRAYAYGKIELPLLEKAELFARSVGETTDIVEKEMYAFEDKDGTIVALRPEGTASVVRAYLEAGLARAMPVARFYYDGPMFRRERPQKGRLRQFHQIGAELLGRDDPASDAETLCLVADLCAAVGIASYRIDINSVGDAACRPAYRGLLADFARTRVERLCADCRTRLERNPLRLLDCKNPSCNEVMAEAPMMVDHLCRACAEHHEQVLAQVAEAGVEVTPRPRLVRGLDYYCRTAFEIVAGGLGSQDAIGGGGRYDGLVAALGGPDVAGTGFAFGIERMELALGDAPAGSGRPEMLVAPVGERAAGVALKVARKLRSRGVVVELESASRKLKAQMKRADKAGARYVVIIGEDELAGGRATVRDMSAQTDRRECFALDDRADAILDAIREAG